MADRFCCCFFVLIVILGFTKGFRGEVFNCSGQLETSSSPGNGGFKLFVEGSPEFYRSEKVYTGFKSLMINNSSFNYFNV